MRAVIYGRGGFRAAALVVFLCGAVACTDRPAPLRVSLRPASSTDPAAILVGGLSGADVSALRAAAWDSRTWTTLLTVTVADNASLPVAGEYRVATDAIEFHPRFPFDPGRTYHVRFDPSRLPVPRNEGVVAVDIEVPAAAAGPVTRVVEVWPTSDAWPENTLRFYIEFSAPMSRGSGLGFVRLEDDGGKEITGAFLPLDVDLWSGDRKRFTVFFDPGRVKRGIRPNVEQGRALNAGRRYAIVVDSRWPDASGRPLASGSRYVFRAEAAEERALTPAGWQVAAPPAATRDPLVVSFPWMLDRALLLRAIGVARSDGSPVDGDVQVATGEREWRFVPRDSWRAGAYQLTVLTVLEDPAGNRVGRPFEVEMLEKPRPDPGDRVSVPFVIK